MDLTGDAAGIAVLHEMKESNKEYLKFLIQEARTVFEQRVDYKGKDGVGYRLAWNRAEQKFIVSRVDSGPSKPG